MSSSNVTLHRRPDLWYGKYRYSLRLKLVEASCLRSFEDKHIAKTLEARRRWGRRMMDSAGLFSPAPGSWRWQTLEITDQDEQNLYAMRDVLTDLSQPYHKTIYGDWMYIYTNDGAVLDRIQALPFLDPRTMERGEIEQHGTSGHVMLKNPQYQYRTYLREMRLEPGQELSFRNWIKSQQDIKLSPSLRRWCEWETRYLSGYYFFDHDSLGVVTMLNMIVPRAIRKTLPCEKAK